MSNISAKRITRNRRSHHRLVGRLLTGFLAAVLLLNLLLPDRGFSANENRSLAQRPGLSAARLLDGSFFSEYLTYYSDQFLGRDFWVSLNFKVSHLFGQREFNGVYVGDDGYLLARPTEPDTEALSSTAAAINRFAGLYPDIRTSMILVPDAATILSDRLPADAPTRDQVADIRSFQAELADSVHKINAAAVLKEHAKEQIYYRTDHHWTSEAAYEVFKESADTLDVDSDDVGYVAHMISDTFQGTLASKSGDYSRKDVIEVYEPQGTDVLYYVNYPDLQKKSRSVFVSEQLKEKDQYTVFFGGNHPLVEIRTTADNGRSLLIFKDSYANSFVQFLTPYYENIIMVDPRYYYDDIAAAIRAYAVTDILYLYSADTLFADRSLADVLNAAAKEETAEETAEEAL